MRAWKTVDFFEVGQLEDNWRGICLATGVTGHTLLSIYCMINYTSRQAVLNFYTSTELRLRELQPAVRLQWLGRIKMAAEFRAVITYSRTTNHTEVRRQVAWGWSWLSSSMESWTFLYFYVRQGFLELLHLLNGFSDAISWPINACDLIISRLNRHLDSVSVAHFLTTWRQAVMVTT